MLKVIIQEKGNGLECSCELDGTLGDICNQTLEAIRCIYSTLLQISDEEELFLFREMVKTGIQRKDSFVWRKPEKEEK